MRYFLLFVFFIVRLFAQNEEVSLQLSWKHQFQFAGFYMAKEKGFYDEAGLDVVIKEYDNSIDTVSDVVSKKATYGIGRSSLIIQRNKGKPVVALAAIYQSSPSVLITTNPDIISPSNLAGKKVMISKDEAQSASILTMLLANGISQKDLKIQKHSFDYNDLINKNTDAMACYLSNEPIQLQLKGIKYKVFNPKDYGYDFYGDILFTSEDELQNHYERANSFNTASKKGWLWAFENIEESAKIIFEKYNSQNKSLDSLIYEGYVLKKLAFLDDIPFGHISKDKVENIARFYQLAGLIGGSYTLKGFTHLHMNKIEVKIGVLAKRGLDIAHNRWDFLAEYLNNLMETYNFKIVPLDFSELEKSVKNNSLDFVITNTMYYVILENRYGLSRIATLVNRYKDEKNIKEFGGVVFTRNDNKNINSFKDLKNKSFGAVSKLSFGGWIMAYDEFLKNGLHKDSIKVRFLNTHDAVVEAVLSGDVSAGTVRTDTLERMAAEGKIDLSDIKVIGAKKYIGFPYLVSTKLYPEWPIAKLKNTSDSLSNILLSKLVTYKPSEENSKNTQLSCWSVPSDYSSVHNLLRELHLPPYDKQKITLMDILEEYEIYIYIGILLFVVVISRIIYDFRINSYLNKYSLKLNEEVQAKTKKLTQANEKLKVIAQTDALTGISNRGYFMRFAKKYFEIAKRNNEDLQILSLDLDYFKSINDTYGHQAGDDVLREFTKTVSALLRKSDMFGRIGGEEFCILLQNTSVEGACLFAQRVCEAVEGMRVESGDKILKITVSIGVATLNGAETVEELIEKSDIALYQAKENGRNQVKVYKKEE